VRAISALWATLSMLAKALKRLVAIATPYLGVATSISVSC